MKPFSNQEHLDKVEAQNFASHVAGFSQMPVSSDSYQDELRKLIKHANKVNSSINHRRKNLAQENSEKDELKITRTDNRGYVAFWNGKEIGSVSVHADNGNCSCSYVDAHGKSKSIYRVLDMNELKGRLYAEYKESEEE